MIIGIILLYSNRYMTIISILFYKIKNTHIYIYLMKRHNEPHSVRHVTILKCYFCTLTCFDMSSSEAPSDLSEWSCVIMCYQRNMLIIDAI